MRFVSLALAATIAACGTAPSNSADDSADNGADNGDENSADKAAPRSLYVADAAALPECNAEAEGWLVYVKADKAFKACLSGEWAAVEAPAAEPAAVAIDAQWTCGMTSDIDSDPTTQTRGLEAQITRLSSGTYVFFCSDISIDSNFTDTDSSSETLWFDASLPVVASGELQCSGFYAKATFKIADASLVWTTLAGDPAVAASCTKTK